MGLGPRWTAEHIAKELTPEKLDHLVRDILIVGGYQDVQTVDGPGDGGRDLEATHPSGHKILVQVKHRQSSETRTSSDEFGELAIAMLRLGRKKGLFVTNGLLSAPAKRDSLSAYPGLSIKFWEGADLVRLVIESASLSALWIREDHIERAVCAISFAFLARDRWTDETFFLNNPLLHPAEELVEFVAKALPANLSLGRMDRKRYNIRHFEPLRPPTVRSLSEGFDGHVAATEFCVHGLTALSDLKPLQHALLNAIASYVARKAPTEAVALRVSCPMITPLSGAHEGEEIEVDVAAPTTVVTTGDGAWTDERAYYGQAGGFARPSWIQTYQVMHGLWRLLVPGDLLVELSLVCRPSGRHLYQLLEKREWFERWWGRSLFAIVPTLPLAESIPPPEICMPTLDGPLCLWLHPIFDREMRPLPSGDERDGGHDHLAELPQDMERMSRLRNEVQAVGGRAIDPNVARHLVAARYGDPFPSVTMVHYDAAEIIVNTEALPSPVAEPAIAFAFVVYLEFDNAAWAAKFCESCPSELDGWTAHSLLGSEEERTGQIRQFSVGIGDRTRDAVVVRLTLTPQREWCPEPVWHRLANLLPEAESRVAALVTHQVARRISRDWMRSRWLVFFEPESPTHPVPVFLRPDGTTLTSSDFERD